MALQRTRKIFWSLNNSLYEIMASIKHAFHEQVDAQVPGHFIRFILDNVSTQIGKIAIHPSLQWFPPLQDWHLAGNNRFYSTNPIIKVLTSCIKADVWLDAVGYFINFSKRCDRILELHFFLVNPFCGFFNFSKFPRNTSDILQTKTNFHFTRSSQIVGNWVLNGGW